MALSRAIYKQPVNIVRWIARALGTLVVLLIVLIAAGEGLPEVAGLSLREKLLFLALAMILVGLIAAWKWEGAGSALILGGFTAFAVVDRSLPLNLVFSSVLFTGIMYFFCWWSTRQSSSSALQKE